MTSVPATRASDIGVFYPFHFRDFRILWIALLTRSAALWMDQIVRPILIFELTDSAFLVGSVLAARMAPNFILGLYAGTIVDRYPRRNVLAASQLLNVGATGVLLILLIADAVEAWHVIALVSVSGINIAFFQPARQAILPSIVPPEALRGAVALGQTANNAMRIGGGVLSGILLAVASFTEVYIAMTVLYALAVVMLLMMRTDARPAPGRAMAAGWRQSTMEGIRWARRERRPVAVLGLSTVLFMFIAPYQAVWVPLLVIDELGRDRSWVGYMAIAIGVGAVSATLIVATVRTLPSPFLFMIGMLGIAGGLLVALSLAPNLAVLAILLFGIGGMTVSFMTVSNLTMLSLAPAEMSGRALSLMSVSRGLIPIGALVAGALADGVGIRTGLLLMGLMALALMALTFLLSPARRDARAVGETSGVD
jgi:MFS family permease